MMTDVEPVREQSTTGIPSFQLWEQRLTHKQYQSSAIEVDIELEQVHVVFYKYTANPRHPFALVFPTPCLQWQPGKYRQ